MRTEIRTITPEYAQELLKMNTVNRNPKQHIVSLYADQMKRGQWRSNGEAIQISKGRSLLNGQHRLLAIIESGLDIEMLLVWDVEDDAIVTYDQGKPRTLADIFGMRGIKHYTAISSIINAYMMLCAGRLFNEVGGSNMKLIKKSKEDCLAEYEKRPQLFDEVAEITLKCYQKCRMMTPQETGGYIAYLVLGKKHDIKTVEDFFLQLFALKNIENNTTGLFRDKLLNAKMGNYKLSAKYRRALFIKTWNAHITGKTYKMLSWNESAESMPEFI